MNDFRSHRKRLPDEVFLLPRGQRKRPGPTDLVSEKIWDGIVHLPDDVALTTSNHRGTELAALYALWADWIEATGENQDEMSGGMLDAADCFQASTFDSLHGFYRSAVANLRSALELVTIGALGNLSSKDPDYRRWAKQNLGSLPFQTCMKKLRRVARGVVPTSVLKAGNWPEELYDELCRFTHARPDASDGQIWRSNGPIYVTAGFSSVYELQVTAYAVGYVFARLARPGFVLPKRSGFLFKTPGLLWTDEIAKSYEALSPAT